MISKRRTRKLRKLSYNPLWYKGLHREASKQQPHSKECRCKSCIRYLSIIGKLNPARHDKLTEKPDGFFTQQALPDYVHQRRMRAYSIGSWRG